MRIFEMTGANTIAVFPGRFHPPHKGHIALYNQLKKRFGTAFIATSDKQDDDSPFTFNEKEYLFGFAGIHDDIIHKTQSPYSPKELLQHYDPTKTIVVFGMSDKDKNRFEFKPKKDGSPSYMQPWQKDMKPFSMHSYILTIPTIRFTILGRKFENSTQIRQTFPRLDNNQQQQFIQDLYGKYDRDVHALFKKRLK